MMRTVIVATLLALAPACGPGRTAAATQPTPKAFDPASSDAKSLEVIDAMQAALGGPEKWPLVKQVRWTYQQVDGETLKGWLAHSWDIWNGRHRCEVADMSSVVLPTAENPNPDPPRWSVAMYDLFDVDSASGYATYDGQELGADDRRNLKKQCFGLWKQQSYQLVMFHKLKDPGVKLAYEGQIKDHQVEGVGSFCADGCDSIKVTFAPEVGKDSWWVHVNTKTRLPEVLEFQPEGKAGRVGLLVRGWQEAGGLKFPTVLLDVASKTQAFKMSGVQIGDPDVRLYVPVVR